MDKDKLDELMKNIGRPRKDAYALAALMEQGVIVDFETGRLRWPPNYK